MSIVTLNKDKLTHNFNFLQKLFSEKNIEWSVVTKVLCGNETFLQEVLSLPIEEFCDSRISNLKKIKALSPEAQTVYIKPVPFTFVEDVLSYADVSFNTEINTLTLLSRKAAALNTVHKTVIMIEMGELREGVVRERLLDFFAKVKDLPHIEIVGIGTNLTCMNGVLPDDEKMRELYECRQELEEMFGIRIPYISGGASVAIPLIMSGEMPEYINHFRVGETLFFGTNVYDHSDIEGMCQDVFKLHAEIIEIKEKPNIPEGKLGYNLTGEKKDFSVEPKNSTSKRAIIDVGLLEMNLKDLKPIDESLKIVGGSSDMLVLDIEDAHRNYKVGDFITFNINYMGLLSLMNSDYVEKKTVKTGREQLNPA
ncbi:MULTISPECIES: alanine racemase [Kaistella]|uniref:alanine racemase n=1 Tax=Kaistella TaxID=2782231 RepID=UPI001A27E86C|nr:alanine/ornithine racemase family PLP-dependent enzyme [Chryseobacterium faecale]MBH1959595.1 alanine/ornithine racemase family PLP-dependent enzyme [Flavobacteriia bacterium]MBP3840006.1 alanine/ornithine racemase family PLP-dependent enzyme [Chryseobacterium sp.]UFK97725.1 alanine/ornithine racemase family PLP-dependent enzyme [Chryseobacterium faecale]